MRRVRASELLTRRVIVAVAAAPRLVSCLDRRSSVGLKSIHEGQREGNAQHDQAQRARQKAAEPARRQGHRTITNASSLRGLHEPSALNVTNRARWRHNLLGAGVGRFAIRRRKLGIFAVGRNARLTRGGSTRTRSGAWRGQMHSGRLRRNRPLL